MDYLDIADRAWPVLGPLMRGHAALYRATGGRIGSHVPGLPPMLLLDHVGRKSGRTRTVPLVYMSDDDGTARLWDPGTEPELARYRDLLARRARREPVAYLVGHKEFMALDFEVSRDVLVPNPDTEVQLGSERVAVKAREVDGEERGRLWPRLVGYNPLWGRYQARTKRTIPVFVLGRNS